MEKINNKKIYDDTWSDWVDMKVYGPASRWLRFLISKQLETIKSDKVQKIESVLDVGSGEGTITNMLAEKLPESKVVGIDFSIKGINCSKSAYKQNNLKFLHDEDSSELNNKFDLVTSFEVLEHVEDWEELVGRMANASNRYILLSFPTGRMRAFEVNVGHYRNFKKGEIETFLEKKGFYPRKIFYAGFPFYNPLYQDVCNVTNSGGSSFTKGKYNWFQKTVGLVVYFLFAHLSTQKKYGDQFCGLFERKLNNL
jgi:SAM-dependent methyltransferase